MKNKETQQIEILNPEMDPNFEYPDGSYLACFHEKFVEFKHNEDPYSNPEEIKHSIMEMFYDGKEYYEIAEDLELTDEYVNEIIGENVDE